VAKGLDSAKTHLGCGIVLASGGGVTSFDDMKNYVGFSEADEVRLCAFAKILVDHRDECVDDFYTTAMSSPGSAAVLADDAQVQRLKRTMKVWMLELLTGPWDEAYYERRRKIGVRHVEVKLPDRYMYTAMSVMRRSMTTVAVAKVPKDELVGLLGSLERVTTLDLAIMTGTYIATRAEQQVAQFQDLIVSNMPVHILLIDSEGVISASTQPGARMFNSSKVVGQQVCDVVPETLWRAADLEHNLGYAASSNREVVLVRVDAEIDGECRSFTLTIVPVHHAVARLLLHIDELTDAVHTETRLRKAESLARLGSMSAAVAHELRNPLAGISGAIQVITQTLPENDRRRGVMLKVDGQLRRLDRLVSDLLIYARPLDAVLMDVDLFVAAQATGALIAAEYPDVDVQVEGRGRARADGNLLQQILINLCKNGAQAQEGAGVVRLQVDGCTIKVSDAGPGIAKSVVPTMYEPFFTTKMRGTGLGLAICRKLADVMDADFGQVESPLSGACFRLRMGQLRE
jgi:signal transduction histidine kinase